MAPTSGGTVPIKSSKACVVYDADSGRVHHIHQVVTLEGGREPIDQETEAHAVAPAKQKERRPANCRCCDVPFEAVKPHQQFTVDIKARKLIAKERT